MANVNWYGDQFKKIMDEKLDSLMDESGEELRLDIYRNFTDPGSGRMYYSRSYHKKYHYASLPGEEPAVDTWKLKMSMEYEVYKTGWERRIRIGTKVKYGLFMELGTPTIAPRPFITTGIQRYYPIFIQKLKMLGI